MTRKHVSESEGEVVRRRHHRPQVTFWDVNIRGNDIVCCSIQDSAFSDVDVRGCITGGTEFLGHDAQCCDQHEIGRISSGNTL